MPGTLVLYRRLFLYDQWANGVIAEALQTDRLSGNGWEAEKLFAHIVAAQQLWHRRVSGERSPKMETWPEWELAESIRQAAPVAQKWQQLLARSTPADLATRISYRNTKGEPYETALSDILAHVVIHGQHHRAQIAQILRKGGLTPPPTDFIAYTRLTEPAHD